MRKSFIATLVLGALVIASCQKENDYAPKAESPVFTASFDTEAPADPDTKTQLVEGVDGVKKSHWVSGDAIRLFNGTNTTGCTADYTTTDEDATASFTTTEKGYTGTKFIATYPASEANYAWWNSKSDNIINKLWLRNTQTAVKGGYDPKAHIAVAYTDTKNLSFSNAVSLLKFTVAKNSEEISSISITVPNVECIAGNFNCKVKVGDDPMVLYKDGEGSHHSTASLTGKFEAGESYYLAVLPGEYSKLTLSVNGKEFKTKAKGSTFKANSIYNMGEINGSKTLYLKPNGNWMKDSPWFAVYLFGNGTDPKWVKMEAVGDTGYYKAEVPSKYTNVIFCRIKPDSELSWGDHVWNQTNDLSFDATNNCYTVTEGAWSKGDGTWSVYQK